MKGDLNVLQRSLPVDPTLYSQNIMQAKPGLSGVGKCCFLKIFIITDVIILLSNWVKEFNNVCTIHIPFFFILRSINKFQDGLIA
jgi:hypothetical protein